MSLRLEYRLYEAADPLFDLIVLEELSDQAIRQIVSAGIRLVTVKVDDWNTCFSPWPAEGLRKGERFAGKADELIRRLDSLIDQTGSGNQIVLAGYSLAGLFALYNLFRTDKYSGIIACSPSVWYPGFVEYVHQTKPRPCRNVYLSLGVREEMSRNPLWRNVGGQIREVYDYLENDPSISRTVLEWNEGGHFHDPQGRLIKGVLWMKEEWE